MHRTTVLVLLGFVGTSSCFTEDYGICHGFSCFHDGEVEFLDGECACLCHFNYSGNVCQFDNEESEWPDGPYSLPVPSTGCVEAQDRDRGWRPGYIVFKLQGPPSTLPVEYASNWLRIADDTSFQLNFCTKLERETDSGQLDWASEHYGILQAGESCPYGFLERNISLQLPEFQSWFSDGELPNFELNINKHSIKLAACMREQHSNGTTTVPLSKPLYLLKDQDFECPTFDGFEVTEEFLLARRPGEEDVVSYSLCYIRPFTSILPVYSFDEWVDLGFVPTCLEALGMQDKSIDDFQLFATSYFGVRDPGDARPGRNGWCPDYFHDSEAYFQIDLLTAMMIEAIEVYDTRFPSVANISKANGRIKTYAQWSISYAVDFMKFRNYSHQVLSIAEQPEQHRRDLILLKPFVARFVRIHPANLMDACSARFELLGCKNDVKLSFEDWIESVFPASCFENLGLADGTIEDFQITSSTWKSGYTPDMTRPGLAGWCADFNDNRAYIQVDLFVPVYVEALRIYDIQSITLAIQRLCNVSVEYRNIRISYASGSEEFRSYHSQVYNISTLYEIEIFFLKPFVARFVRIHIVNATATPAPCLRFELVGCKSSGSWSQTCSKNAPHIWIDDPIILTDTTPEDLSSPNISSVESCQHACQETMEDCSTVQYGNGDKCLVYSSHDSYRSEVLSPVITGDIWRAKMCWNMDSEKTMVVWHQQVIQSSGYPLHYASEKEVQWSISIGDPKYYSVVVTFTSISLHPPTTQDCVDKIQLVARYDGVPFPDITYEYNNGTLYAPTMYNIIYIKFTTCPRLRDKGQRYYGFRAIVDRIIGFRVLWPQKRTELTRIERKGADLMTYSLLGHPMHTLTKDTWRIGWKRNYIIETLYFNVPCEKGHQFHILAGSSRYEYCNPNKPVWPHRSEVLIVEYLYGAPTYASGFHAVAKPVTISLHNYFRPKDCQFPWMLCSDKERKCVPPEMICDNETYCENDESEYACQHHLPETCSPVLHKCYAVKVMMGSRYNTGYWRYRNYSKDCSDIDGQYTLPTIHTKATIKGLRTLLANICLTEKLSTCYETIFLDIGLQRYFTDDGIQEMWGDGTRVSFTAWKGQRTPTQLCTSLVFDTFDDDGYFVYRPCEQSLSSVLVLCERPYNKTEQGIIYIPSTRSSMFSSLYECLSGEMIHIAAVCDGIADCADGSDEIACKGFHADGCTFEEFECGNGACIGLQSVCDYIQDCFPEGKDENCDFPDCQIGEFRCQNKQCVPNYVRCDAIKDCKDGTDESFCESCNETSAVPCGDLTCIHKDFVCDGISSCKFGQDETSCGSSFSTCFELWQAGHRTNGTYQLNGVLDVQCNFFMLNEHTINVETLIHTEVYDHLEGFEFHLGSLAPYIRLSGNDIYHAEDATCKMKIDVNCTPNILQLELYEDLDPKRRFELCSDQSLAIEFDWKRFPFGLKLSSGISYANIESLLRRDILIVVPTKPMTQYSMAEFGPIECSKEYRVDERTIACGDGTIAAYSTKCIYDVGRAGNIIGCQTFAHLEDCREFECPFDEYVKCPDDFCIPWRFVCDGIKQCRDGGDELSCNCNGDEGQVSIVYSGDASEAKRSYIYNFARLLNSMTRDVRVVSLAIKGTDVVVKTRLIHHSSEALNRNKWQEYTVPKSAVLDIIEKTNKESLPHDIVVIYDEHIPSDIDIEIGISEISSRRETQVKMFYIDLKRDIRQSAVRNEGVNTTKIVVKSWDVLGSTGSTLINKCREKHNDRCAGKFKCMSSRVCIPLRQVCDGITQCLFGDDERLCDFPCPMKCSCGNYVINCSAADLNTTDFHTMPTSVRSLDLSNSFVFKENKLSFPYSFTVLVRLNISSCHIIDISNKAFEKTKNLLHLDLSNNKLKIVKKDTFIGLTNLEILILTGNNEIELLESSAFHSLFNIRSLTLVNTRVYEILPETFSGLRLTSLDISNNNIRKIYDMAFSGLDVDTLVIDGNDVTDFGKDIFTGMRNVRTIISPAFKFCCYRPDYVVENNCLPTKDEFSSCEDLMRNSGLQTLLWVIGVSASVGNSLSIVYRLTVDRVRLKLGFGIFVTNLAISDLLMGIYLLIIAVADLTFRKRYIEVEAEWRNSFLCKLAGVLATLSSEASVIFMCLITLDRILVIKFPFGNIRFRTKSAIVFTLAGWGVAGVIAIFPLLYSDLFEDQFYSKSGVCLALPLTRNRAPGWLYSVFIFVGFNFVTFIMIAIGQLIIYLEINKSSKRMAKIGSSTHMSLRRKDIIVARNLFLVLSTDFLCWFPIGVIAIMAMTGYQISGDVYAWTAVTVLPINSALNPILYTATAVLRRKAFMEVKFKRKRSDSETRKDICDFGEVFKKICETNKPQF